MKTIYLSGKMTGLPDLNRPKFSKYEAELTAQGFRVLNPHNFLQEGKYTWQEYMRNDIKHLMDCDIVAVLNDWCYSKGAIAEVLLSMQLGISIVNAHDLSPIALPRLFIEFDMEQASIFSRPKPLLTLN